MSSTEIRKQDVHTNGPVLDDDILQDPLVTKLFSLLFLNHFLVANSFFFLISTGDRCDRERKSC